MIFQTFMDAWIFLLGFRLNNAFVAALGLSLTTLPLGCFALWVTSVPLLLVLEKLFPNPANDT